MIKQKQKQKLKQKQRQNQNQRVNQVVKIYLAERKKAKKGRGRQTKPVVPSKNRPTYFQQPIFMNTYSQSQPAQKNLTKQDVENLILNFRNVRPNVRPSVSTASQTTELGGNRQTTSSQTDPIPSAQAIPLALAQETNTQTTSSQTDLIPSAQAIPLALAQETNTQTTSSQTDPQTNVFNPEFEEYLKTQRAVELPSAPSSPQFAPSTNREPTELFTPTSRVRLTPTSKPIISRREPVSSIANRLSGIIDEYPSEPDKEKEQKALEQSLQQSRTTRKRLEGAERELNEEIKARLGEEEDYKKKTTRKRLDEAERELNEEMEARQGEEEEFPDQTDLEEFAEPNLEGFDDRQAEEPLVQPKAKKPKSKKPKHYRERERLKKEKNINQDNPASVSRYLRATPSRTRHYLENRSGVRSFLNPNLPPNISIPQVSGSGSIPLQPEPPRSATISSILEEPNSTDEIMVESGTGEQRVRFKNIIL